MNFFKKIEQRFCKHWPVESYIFTRTKKDGSMQKKVRWKCLKCGMKTPNAEITGRTPAQNEADGA